MVDSTGNIKAAFAQQQDATQPAYTGLTQQEIADTDPRVVTFIAASNVHADPSGFIQSCKSAIGLTNILANASLFAMVQLSMDAIQQDQMGDLATIITTAQSTGLITAAQYAAIKAAATQYNIPVTLP